MTRRRLCLLLSCSVSVALLAQPQKRAPEREEEDESAKPKVYSFNPLQAQKELETGNFYFKKHAYKAAASRYLEATKWDKNLAEAYLRLGDAEEKLKDMKAANEAYLKYLKLDPNSKQADALKKKLARK